MLDKHFWIAAWSYPYKTSVRTRCGGRFRQYNVSIIVHGFRPLLTMWHKGYITNYQKRRIISSCALQFLGIKERALRALGFFKFGHSNNNTAQKTNPIFPSCQAFQSKQRKQPLSPPACARSRLHRQSWARDVFIVCVSSAYSKQITICHVSIVRPNNVYAGHAGHPSIRSGYATMVLLNKPRSQKT